MSEYGAIEKEARIYTELCEQRDRIDPALFDRLGVKRGLRDKDGKGVLTGITNISRIDAFEERDGKKVPCEGKLWYRGYNVYDLIRGLRGKRYGFEEAAYLLLMGDLPTAAQLADFTRVLTKCRDLPTNFIRDVIMKPPSKDLMNSLTRSVLTLASYDDTVGDGSLQTQLEQCIKLISVFPMLAVYGYHAYNYYVNGDSMYIHRPQPELSTAENLLQMLRPDRSYTPLEAHVLDTALLLHMEHGGGNNSTFTTRVVTSSGSDTYSVMSAALCSLKGPKHAAPTSRSSRWSTTSAARCTTKPTRTKSRITSARSSTSRRSTIRASSTAWGHAGLLSVRPARRRLQELRPAAGRSQGPQGGFRFLQHDRAPGPAGHCRKTPHLQGAFPPTSTSIPALSTTCWTSLSSFTPPIFAIARNRRLERPPAGGACQCGQDHPPGLCKRHGTARVYPA